MTSQRAEPTASTAQATGPRTSSARTIWTLARPLAGVAILIALVWRLGAGPFLDALGLVDGWSLLAAFVIGALTTAACAWRWSLVSHGLGIRVPMRRAVAAYYQSQFINLTLPGGVLGDVHRGVRHGRDEGDVGRGVRAVVWERSAGQAVQVSLTVVVLLLVPSPVRSSMPAAAAAVAAIALGAVLLSRLGPRHGPSRWARIVHTAAADLRSGLLARQAWPGILFASSVVVFGHAATFVIAARTVGVSASTFALLPLALLVLLAMSLPLSIGGWGPREGVAAWAFALAGLGAATGVTTAVVYGVMVLVASLPGAFALLAIWLRSERSDREGGTGG
jgi:uncharacterized membrane protein YbhN (UPF0104 family)